MNVQTVFTKSLTQMTNVYLGIGVLHNVTGYE